MGDFVLGFLFARLLTEQQREPAAPYSVWPRETEEETAEAARQWGESCINFFDSMAFWAVLLTGAAILILLLH